MYTLSSRQNITFSSRLKPNDWIIAIFLEENYDEETKVLQKSECFHATEGIVLIIAITRTCDIEE